MIPGRALAGSVTFVLPGDRLPPDTLVLQWTAGDGKAYDLGRYGRPVVVPTAPDSTAPERATLSKPWMRIPAPLSTTWRPSLGYRISEIKRAFSDWHDP